MEDRTTEELINTLGDDVDRCHKALVEAIDDGTVEEDGGIVADYQFYARQFVRAVFSYIEGITFSVKVSAAHFCMENGVNISAQERFFAVDVDHALDDKGEVIEQRAMLRLATNVRFAFMLTERAHGIEKLFDPSIEWWSCFKKSIKVRDRLMHPKMPEDIDISGDEIIAVLKAYSGFNDLLMEYSKCKPKTRKRAKYKAVARKPAGT